MELILYFTQSLLILAFLIATIWLVIQSGGKLLNWLFMLAGFFLLLREISLIGQLNHFNELPQLTDPFIILITGFLLTSIILYTKHTGNIRIQPIKDLPDPSSGLSNFLDAISKETNLIELQDAIVEQCHDITRPSAVLLFKKATESGTFMLNTRQLASYQKKYINVFESNPVGRIRRLSEGLMTAIHKEGLIELNAKQVGELLPSSELVNKAEYELMLKMEHAYALGFSNKNRLYMLMLILTENRLNNWNTMLSLRHVASAVLYRAYRNESLQAFNSKYVNLVNHLAEIVIYKDFEGRWDLINEQARDILQISQSEYKGRTNKELRTAFPHNESLFDFLEMNELKSWQSNKTITALFELGTKPNEKRTFQFRFLPTFSIEKVKNATIIIGEDITHSHLAEVSLKKSEKQFRELMQRLPYGLVVIDYNDNVQYVNPTFQRIFGYTLNDLPDLESWLHLAYPDEEYRNKARNDWEKSMTMQTTAEMYRIYKVRTKYNNDCMIRFRWGKLHQERMYVLMEDLTKEFEAKKRERENQKDLVKLSKSAMELITLAGQDEILKFIGHELQEMIPGSKVLIGSIENEFQYIRLFQSFGLSDDFRKQLLQVIPFNPQMKMFKLSPYLKYILLKGKLVLFKEGLRGILSEEMDSDTLDHLQEQLAIQYMYIIGLVREGTLYAALAYLSPTKLPRNKFSYIETFMHQASIALQQKELEQELIHAKEKAEESDKLKSAFLANMSHEVRTPMNSIVGFSELLSSPDYSEDEKQAFTKLIHDNSRQLMKLITDIVDISKIEAGQINLEFSKVDLNALLDRMFSTFQNELTKRNKNEVELTLHKGINNRKLVILSDEGRLTQIFTNLIGNAVKFTNKGQIDFGYKLQSENTLMCYVKDTGIGIDPMHKDVIFRRFRQGSDSEVVKNSGTGLGLSIAKGLVDLMGGEIWFDSLKFKGTNFFFTIPFEEFKDKKIEPNQQAPIIVEDWSEKHILVVEDHMPSYLYIKRILDKTGIHIQHAESADKAVELIMQDANYDVVLMDIRTPQGNGIEATEKIKAMHPDMTVIAQTAYAMEEDRKRCMKAGCDDYLTKPFSKDELLTAIDQLI